MSPSSSSVPTQAAIVAVTAAVVAVMVMVGPTIATMLAGIVVAVLMVLGACWSGGCNGSGVFTKSQKLELGLSSELINNLTTVGQFHNSQKLKKKNLDS